MILVLDVYKRQADTVAQDKQAVAGMLSQTQQAASDAALSAQEAKLSETAAAQAQTGAEAAEDGARQYAEDTGCLLYTSRCV